MLVASLVATMALRVGALTSTWCFFSSIIGVLAVIALRRARSATP